MGFKMFALRGHPRSGTNWTGRLLNLHPAVNCQGEYHFNGFFEGLEWFARPVGRIGQRAEHRRLAEDMLGELVREVMRSQAGKKPGASWQGDRSPNPLYPMFADTPHILLRRDGRDVVVSLLLHLLRREQLGQPGPKAAGLRRRFAEDPRHFERRPGDLLVMEQHVRRMARVWRRRLRQDARTARGMEAGDLPGRVLVVRYEDMHDDVERERTRMYRFLGLNPGRAEPVSDASETSPGLGRGGSEDPTSHNRSARSGAWEKYVHREAGRWIQEAAGVALAEFGYEDDPDWWRGLPTSDELNEIAAGAGRPETAGTEARNT